MRLSDHSNPPEIRKGANEGEMRILERIRHSVAAMPDLTLETDYANSLRVPLETVCGIDEAGRGPWAGPVAAAAVILDPNRLPNGIDDSKRLTHAQRVALFDVIHTQALASCVVMISAQEIDSTNILKATMQAMAQAVQGLTITPTLALVDGNRAPNLTCRSFCVIGGDRLSLSIAAASILAKVARDRLMAEADDLYPGYGFAQHKGYGTKAHQEALERLGPCPIHRLSYKPVAKVLQTFQN
ncbi:MAG: ribonuclease HII [Alphaproteobacteria bacterium PA3]|nr:MAG: ribonuclease HII [Alphaproteobacteria bacterium PA3]